MLKKLIAPLQKILLQKHICPGCTSKLTRAKFREPISQKADRVTCECGRIYIYDKELDTYRRALDTEV